MGIVPPWGQPVLCSRSAVRIKDIHGTSYGPSDRLHLKDKTQVRRGIAGFGYFHQGERQRRGVYASKIREMLLKVPLSFLGPLLSTFLGPLQSTLMILSDLSSILLEFPSGSHPNANTTLTRFPSDGLLDADSMPETGCGLPAWTWMLA